MKDTCKDCRFFKRGYRLQNMKIPDWCDRHFHSQRSDDHACAEFQPMDTRSIQHPPYCHPGDMA